ncbi:MAG: CARDB domain-containing protein [Thermoleophilaceae bacterium]
MDRQTLFVRRGIAAAGGVLVLILLILGIKGCLSARKERAIKDYVQEVSGLTQESDQQGKQLFQILSGPGGRDQAVNIQNSLNGFRVQSAQLVDHARDLHPPDELKSAQRNLVEALTFRRDGLAAVADSLPTALGDRERRQGTERVTAQMQAFLTSDVIYTQRFLRELVGVLRDKKLDDEVRLPRSQFVPDIQWLQPAFVSERVAGIRTGRGGKAATPGLHGDGLGSVTLGGQALTPGASATVRASGSLAFSVQVVNQGQGTETDVPVRVTIGRGGNTIKAEDTLTSIAAGETKTVNVPITEAPPTGQSVPITVEVVPVPGEKKTDNNKQTFSAIFTR